MPQWRHTLPLADIWHDDALSFEETRDEVVRRIRAARFYSTDDTRLVEIVDELAETDDEKYFDEVFNYFYDWADAERVWVATF